MYKYYVAIHIFIRIIKHRFDLFFSDFIRFVKHLSSFQYDWRRKWFVIDLSSIQRETSTGKLETDYILSPVAFVVLSLVSDPIIIIIFCFQFINTFLFKLFKNIKFINLSFISLPKRLLVICLYRYNKYNIYVIIIYRTPTIMSTLAAQKKYFWQSICSHQTWHATTVLQLGKRCYYFILLILYINIYIFCRAAVNSYK